MSLLIKDITETKSVSSFYQQKHPALWFRSEHEGKACLLNIFVFKSYSIPVTKTGSGHHILSETIQKYLGHSAGWFRRARKIVELLERIGATDTQITSFVKSNQPEKISLVLPYFPAAVTSTSQRPFKLLIRSLTQISMPSNFI